MFPTHLSHDRHSYGNQGSQSHSQDYSHQQRTKPIKKSQPKSWELKESSEFDDQQPKRKRETAKEIKRIREQNRRANHKEYVNRLQTKLDEKENQVKILQQKIRSLNQEIESLSYSKICSKCGGSLSPPQTQLLNNMLKEEAIDEEAKCYDGQVDYFQQQEESLQRIPLNQRSLRLNFGNNFFFILMTVCCLAAGCIADNAELALEPIMPFKVKSQMCFLPSPAKLNKIYVETALDKLLKSPSYRFYRNFCNKPQVWEEGQRVSDFFKNSKSQNSIPRLREIFSWLMTPLGALTSIFVALVLQRTINGNNYYA